MDRFKIKASTLIEVVVAMVIIVLIFSIAMGIYVNILQSVNSLQKYKAHATLNQILGDLESRNQITRKSFKVDDYLIETNISLYKDQKNLQVIHLAAFNNKMEKLAEVSKIIYEP